MFGMVTPGLGCGGEFVCWRDSLRGIRVEVFLEQEPFENGGRRSDYEDILVREEYFW